MLFLSGESGMATLIDTVDRVCASKGILRTDLKNLFISEFVPRFDNDRHLDGVARAFDETGVELAIVDPTFLAMPGYDAGNLFIQGEMLRGMGDVCVQHGVTLVLIHHFKKRKQKNQRDNDPPDMTDLTWSGFSEWMRQWLLVNRREDYIPGTGEHKLWLSIGGSAGHGGLWGLDLDEGVKPHRHWKYSLTAPSDVREAKKGDCVRDKLLGAMRNFPHGECMTNIFLTAGVRPDCKSKLIFQTMVDEGALVACDVGRGKRTFPGYKLAEKP